MYYTFGWKVQYWHYSSSYFSISYSSNSSDMIGLQLTTSYTSFFFYVFVDSHCCSCFSRVVHLLLHYILVYFVLRDERGHEQYTKLKLDTSLQHLYPIISLQPHQSRCASIWHFLGHRSRRSFRLLVVKAVFHFHNKH
ncbi:unnamed protein product [Amoebophrya sp. A25]|nr:unnamed protein product [Amoebophrya sp. A25]|eukprot:GSA25T00000536001.1